MTRAAKTLADIRKFAREDARRGVMRAFKTPRRIGMKKAASAYHAAYRKKNPDSRDPAYMTASAVNNELDKLDKADKQLTDAMIAAGRGYEKSSETMTKGDPLALKFRALRDRRYALRREIERRAGTDYHRMPRGLKARKNNPVEPLQSRVDASASAYRDFTGHEARGIRKMRVKNFSVGWPLGKLDAVLYSTVRDGKREKYIHRFRSHSRPHLVSSSDGSALAIVGGRYSIRDSGINDE